MLSTEQIIEVKIEENLNYLNPKSYLQINIVEI